MLIVVLLAAGCSKRESASRGASSGNEHLPAQPARTTDVPALDSDRAPAPVPGVRMGDLSTSARRGYALLAGTSDSLPKYVGANMRCFSCHLDEGRRPNATPLVGAIARYPKYAARTGRVITIQDRINYCFVRSLAGVAIPNDSREMKDIVAYLTEALHGTGPEVAGEGMPVMPNLIADSAHGRIVYTATCARCHGANGAGIPPAPPVWGARSYAVGASLARLERAASFIRHNMPYDSAGTLDDHASYDVATYLNAHARPDSRGKSRDWPMGDAPHDVPYSTHNHKAFDPPPLLPYAR